MVVRAGCGVQPIHQGAFAAPRDQVQPLGSSGGFSEVKSGTCREKGKTAI